MKRSNIKDALQVVAALLITGSMASAMSPSPATPETKTIVAHQKPAIKPTQASEKAPKTASKPKKVITWRDNPKHCTKAQYIAKEPPFRCINRPKAVESAPKVAAVQIPSSSGGYMSGCGDNSYAAYIYGMESGGQVSGRCNPSAVNPGGCRGIGQACPGSKLPCGADYACQNRYFNQYAMDRYGSWANAYNFWRGHNYW